MEDRYKFNLFNSSEENSTHTYYQEIPDTVFSITELHIATLPVDFPADTSAKHKKDLENKWMALLPALDSVTSLFIRHKIQQEFFEAICSMKNLESLYCGTSTVDDISSILKLHKLKRLGLDRFSRLKDISPILTLKKLELLSIENSFKIENFDLIGKMTALKGLRLCGDIVAPKNLRLKSLKPFSNLKNLKHLDLSNTRVVDESYETILELENLERFDSTVRIPTFKMELIKANHKKLTAGLFMDWDHKNNQLYEGKKW